MSIPLKRRTLITPPPPIYIPFTTLQMFFFLSNFRYIKTDNVPGCILNARPVTRGECISAAYHLGLVQSFPTLARWASGPTVAIHHNKFIHIFACLYSVYCVTHISTQLAYCGACDPNLLILYLCKFC